MNDDSEERRYVKTKILKKEAQIYEGKKEWRYVKKEM